MARQESGEVVAAKPAVATATVRSAGTPSFARVQIKRAFQAVCDQIREQVATGALRPGDRLPPEKQLAEQFAVSRNAVREALRSLEIAGLVRTQTGLQGGVFIQSGRSDGISQAIMDMVVLGQMPTGNLAEARVLITGLVIRLACERATDDDLAALEADVARLEALVERGGVPMRDHTIGEFHRLLARATHNEAFEMLIGALSEILRGLLVRVDPAPRHDFIKVRRTVLRHLRARDAEAAVRVMTKHLQATHDYLDTQAKRRG